MLVSFIAVVVWLCFVTSNARSWCVAASVAAYKHTQEEQSLHANRSGFGERFGMHTLTGLIDVPTNAPAAARRHDDGVNTC